MQNIKKILQHHVSAFRQWWDDSYTVEQINQLVVKDQDYPDWNSIENFFKYIIDTDQIVDLDLDDQLNILFLIARNEWYSNMIGGYHINDPISNLGSLQLRDFIKLAQTASKQSDPVFNNAKKQFAASVKKLGSLTSETTKLLIDLYNDSDDDTKYWALNSLYTLGYKDIANLISQSLETIEDEDLKTYCLTVRSMTRKGWIQKSEEELASMEAKHDIQEIEVFKQHLCTITETQWKSLFEYIPVIEVTTNFAEIRTPDPLPDGTEFFPYWYYSEMVNNFISLIHEIGLVPNINWVGWDEGRKYLEDDSTDFYKLDMITLCKFFQVITRQERFCDGFINIVFENGLVLKILKSMEFHYERGTI